MRNTFVFKSLHIFGAPLAPVLLLAVLAGLAYPSPEARSAEHRLPIIDTHVHYSDDAWNLLSAEQIGAIWRDIRVLKALVSSTPDEGTLTLYRQAPTIVLPILRPYREGVGLYNWFEDAATPGYLEGRLAKGIYKGIGEFHLPREAAARTGVVQQVARLAAQRGIVLHVHADAPPVRVLFEHEPDVKVLWAHAGMVTRPKVIREMMRAHEKLWAEVSFREGEILSGATLDPDWRALFLDFPGRFMIGTDTYANHRWEEYEDLVEGHRRWLALLPPEIARRIAYRNAAALFGVKDWSAR